MNRRTIYDTLTFDELVRFVLLKDNSTELEISLAQALEVCLGKIEELEEEYGLDPGREGEDSD